MTGCEPRVDFLANQDDVTACQSLLQRGPVGKVRAVVLHNERDRHIVRDGALANGMHTLERACCVVPVQDADKNAGHGEPWVREFDFAAGDVWLAGWLRPARASSRKIEAGF